MLCLLKDSKWLTSKEEMHKWTVLYCVIRIRIKLNKISAGKIYFLINFLCIK